MLEFDVIAGDKVSEVLLNAEKPMTESVRTTFAQIGQHFIARHRRDRLRGRPGLRQHHGQAGLAGSFGYEVVGFDLDSMQLINYSTSIYARIHEHGGIIKAKNVKYLTIPLPAAGGRDTSDARIRDFPGGAFIKSKAGNLLYIDGESGEPLFLLRESVTISASLGWRLTWDMIEPDIIELLSRSAAAAIAGDKS